MTGIKHEQLRRQDQKGQSAIIRLRPLRAAALCGPSGAATQTRPPPTRIRKVAFIKQPNILLVVPRPSANLLASAIPFTLGLPAACITAPVLSLDTLCNSIISRLAVEYRQHSRHEALVHTYPIPTKPLRPYLIATPLVRNHTHADQPRLIQGSISPTPPIPGETTSRPPASRRLRYYPAPPRHPRTHAHHAGQVALHAARCLYKDG